MTCTVEIFFGEFYRKMDVRNGKSVYELPYQAKEITVRTILVKIIILKELTGSRAR